MLQEGCGCGEDKRQGSLSQSLERYSCYKNLLDGPAGKHGRKYMCYNFLFFMGTLACWTILLADAGICKSGLQIILDAQKAELMKMRFMFK